MAYSEIVKKERDFHVVSDLEVTGDKLVMGFKRPATILGFGFTCTLTGIAASRTTAPVLALDHDPLSGARVEKATLSLGTGAIALGTSYEVSELQRGRSPVAPNATMTPFDVVEGDLVFVEVATAGSETTGEGIFYILVAPKGSL